MELGQLIDSLEKELKNENPRLSSSNIKKADLLFSIKSEINSIQDISKHSQSLEQVLLYLSSQASSNPLRRLIKSALESFLMKSKPTKIQSFLSELIKLSQSLKHSNQSKLTTVDIIGFIFKHFSSKLVSPSNEEILDSCKKLSKSSDFQGKRVILQSLNKLLRSRPTNLSQSSSEFLRFYLKSASEKNVELRSLCAKGLTTIASFFPQIFQGQFENCIQTSLKIMEENSSIFAGRLLGEILSMSIDSSLCGHSFTSQRKSLDQFPKTLNDVNYFITQYITRFTSHEVRVGLVLAAQTTYEKFARKSLNGQAEMNSFLESLAGIGIRISVNESESWWSCEVVSWLFNCLVKGLAQGQARLCLEHIKGKISNFSQLDFQSNDPDPLKYSNEYQVIVYLKFLSIIVGTFEDLQVDQKDLEKSLTSLLKFPRIQLQVCWSFESLIKQNSSSVLSLLSTMVTSTTIAYAELECLRSQSYTKDSLHIAINSLIGTSCCLSTLIKLLPSSERGIPVEETEITFNTIKNLVSSEYQGDIIEEEKMFCSDAGMQEIDNAKRQAAWVLVDGLMFLGPSWVGSRLNFLFKLWKLPFGRKTCICEQVSPAWMIGEVTHKKVASSAMLNFMKNNKSLLQPQILKLLIVYLSNALQFLSPAKNSTQHRQFLESNCSPGTLNELRKNLYDCLLLLPGTVIGPKINLILNPIYSEIVTEKTNTQPVFFYFSGKNGKRANGMMQLVDTWLSCEETYIHSYKPAHFLHALSIVTSEGVYDSWEGKNEISHLFTDMLSSAVKLFAEIFTNSSLNVSNRQKLFSFISQHLATAAKAKEVQGKFNKICTILLAVHGCLMKLSSIRGVITDSILTKCIKTMLNSVEGFSHPLTKCLFSESMIYLCKVMSEAQYIPVFMKEIEHRIILSETSPNVKSGIVMQVGNMYKHFDIAVLEKNQDSLGHIIQSISRDENVGAWALHALLKAYSTHKAKVENVFKATFPLGYHHYLNENPAEFRFSDTMMLLCSKHLAISTNSSDIFFSRAKLVWENTWKKSCFGYFCASQLVKCPDFNFQEVLDHALQKFPEKESVLFVCEYGLEEIYQKFNLLEWFRFYDRSNDSQVESALARIIDFWLKKHPESFKKLKEIILSVEKEQEEENKGLSSLNDRENTQQALEFFSHKSKILASEKLVLQIQARPDLFQSSIEEFLNFSVHLTSFSQKLSLKGLDLAVTIFKTFSSMVDPDEPSKKYLEIFEAQLSATIRENFDSPNMDLCFKSCDLLRQFLIVPGTHDSEVISRLLKNLVNSLNNRSNVKLDKEGYTEARATELYTARLFLIGKSLLQAPAFVADLIKEHSRVLIDHFTVLLKDMCVFFTQSKNTLRDHKFLLGKHLISHEDVKMASIEVFIRAVLVLNPSQDLEFFISNIFVFLFLPYSASRESTGFTCQAEVNRCLKRREEVLKALSSIVKFIQDPQIVSELVICLEFCENIPSVSIKNLILEICKKVEVAQFTDLQKLEGLVRKIGSNYSELDLKSHEAWGSIVIKYASMITSEKNVNEKEIISSILSFFIQTLKKNIDLALSILDEIWKRQGFFEFHVFLAIFILNNLWESNHLEVVLEFLSQKPEDEIKNFGEILKKIEKLLLQHDQFSCRIIIFISKKPQNSWIFIHFLPVFLKVFQVRKANYNNEETVFITETIKLLMTIYLKSIDKSKTVSGIFPLFLSLYHQSYPLPIIKAVSKALTYIHVNSSEAFQKSLSELSEAEKKFVESQLETQNLTTAKTVAQPSITLSLRFKKN